jgi:hypothetical protein
MRRKSKRNLKKHISKCTVLQQKSKIKIQPKSQSPPLQKPKRIFKEELDRSDVVHGMARLIYNYIQRYEQFLKPRYPNFPGPRLFNSTESELLQTPRIEHIKNFIQSIFDKRRTLHVESGIIALILLNRTKIKIHSHNWMRLVLISLLLANKHCEDVYSVYNAKFVGLIPNLENLEINILELEFLKFLKYRLHIETKTYEQYYSKLQKFFPVEAAEISVEDDLMITEESNPEITPDHEQSPEITPNHEQEENMETTEEETATNEDEDVYTELCPVIDTGDGSWRDYNFALVDSIA